MVHVLEVGFVPEVVVPHKRLGRHINHDERSRAFAVRPRLASIRTVQHTRHAPVWDQGDTGSCTGNAALGALGSGGLYAAIANLGIVWTEENARAVYSAATRLDTFPNGFYAPDFVDTGSDGMSAAKVLKNKGWISGFRHAFSLEAALTALVENPVITGVPWYDGFDEPDERGMVHATGQARGGHEFVVDGLDAVSKLVWATNSWGPQWGLNGRFCFSWDDWAKLLKQDGDVTAMVPITSPAPTPTPVPAVPTPTTDVDAALWARVRSWAGCRHTGGNKDAANAVARWAVDKGLA